MVRLFFGFVLGALAAAGAGWAWWRAGDGCLDRCAPSTRCVERRCRANDPATATPPAAKDARHRRTRAGGLGADAVKRRPGDEKMVAAGDALGRAEHVDLTQAGDDGRELSEEDLDGVFRGAQPRLSRCIT